LTTASSHHATLRNSLNDRVSRAVNELSINSLCAVTVLRSIVRAEYNTTPTNAAPTISIKMMIVDMSLRAADKLSRSRTRCLVWIAQMLP